MTLSQATFMLMAYLTAPSDRLSAKCVEQVSSTNYIEQLDGLPQEVRDDLTKVVGASVGDRNGPLLRTDAPSAAEKTYPLTRFYRAIRVERGLIVQFEVSLFAGVRTLAYERGDDGALYRNPWMYFGGPACESLNAALNGVTSPPGGWVMRKMDE